MEITFFVLGMLTIILGALVATVVVGLLKITKLTKQVDDLKRQHIQDVEGIYRHISDNQQSLWRQFENAGRDVTMVEKTIMNQIDQTNQELHRRIDQTNQELDIKIGQTKQEVERTIHETHAAIDHVSMGDRKYIDSRIDKLIDTYFDLVGDKIREKKAIIKG